MRQFDPFRALLAFYIVSLSACETTMDEPTAGPAGQQALTEHRFKVATNVSKQDIGGDCTTYGHSACLSGLCLHASARRGADYVCSRGCQQGPDCPEGWLCAPVVPGAVEKVCIPFPGRILGTNQKEATP